MFAPPQAKACMSCARAKRRCGKEQPACRRCRERQIACKYPPAKPSNFVALEPEPLPTMASTDTVRISTVPTVPAVPIVPGLSTFGGAMSSSPPSVIDLLSWPGPSDHLAMAESLTAPPRCILSPDLSLSLPPDRSADTASLLWPLGPPPPAASWFLAPATWEMDCRVHLHGASADVDFMRVQVSGIQAWLKSWAAMGSCPFIHPFLYGDVNGNTPAVRKMPSSVQVAFLALSSYVGRTTATAELVLDAVDAQAQQLLLQEAATALTYAPSLLEQLARVQALVVYQVIGLFDGNAHTRHLAEERRSTLCNWARQLYDSARQGLAGGSSTALPSAGSSDSSDILDGSMAAMQVLPGSDPARTWHFWILAESIRRIWIVADAVDTIYQAMQYGWRTPASSIACTARHGLWQARSAAEWERCCSETVSLSGTETLCNLFDLGQFLDTADAADVDMFCRALMSSAYGRTRVRQWERRSRESRLANTH